MGFVGCFFGDVFLIDCLIQGICCWFKKMRVFVGWLLERMCVC